MTNILDRLWLALIIFFMSAGIYAVILSALGRISYNYPSKEKYPDYNEGFKWGFKAGQLLPDNLCSQIGQQDCYLYVPPDSGDVSGTKPGICLGRGFTDCVIPPKDSGDVSGQEPDWSCKQGASSFIASSTVSKVECEKISNHEGNRK